MFCAKEVEPDRSARIRKCIVVAKERHDFEALLYTCVFVTLPDQAIFQKADALKWARTGAFETFAFVKECMAEWKALMGELYVLATTDR